MKKYITHIAAVCAVATLFATMCGCRDATRISENQQLTKQRQAKIQAHKNQDSTSE